MDVHHVTHCVHYITIMPFPYLVTPDVVGQLLREAGEDEPQRLVATRLDSALPAGLLLLRGVSLVERIDQQHNLRGDR